MIIGKSLTALGCGGLKPEIRVTAKAGALLNLHFKDSSIILKSYQLGASETQHTFVVSVSETAYVAEDATNGKSVEVLVDAVAQYSVKIEYVLWLYKDGDEREAVTSGWTAINYGVAASKNNDFLTLSSTVTAYSGGAFVTNGEIDITGYSKVKIEYALSGTGTKSSFAVRTTPVTDNDNIVTGRTKYVQVPVTSVKTVSEMDISELSGQYYVELCTRNGATAYVSTFNIYRVWLE